MAKSNSKEQWVETGYNVFAKDGLPGIRIEALARMLGLNKSSFYHFFGDLENYKAELIRYHFTNADHLLADISLCTNFDPDYLNTLVRHKVAVIVHMQLVTNRTVPLFFDAYERINDMVDPKAVPFWAAFIGIPHNPELALEYWKVIRDMFYSRVSLDNLNYPFLQNLTQEAKVLAEKMLQENGKLND
jgi:AcrR family transcriptional regulator